MRIAVIGAGISGNVAARLLWQEHDVTVFEAAPTVGGHTRTLDVAAFGRRWQVDTGFMVFNERTYPQFCRLLGLLGLAGQPTDMSFSVSCARSDLEYQGSSLSGLFAQPRNLVRPAFLRMLRDISRFHRDAPELLRSGGNGSLRELLAGGRYGAWFAEKYLVPMTAAIWSCPPERLQDFPAHFLLAFLRNHGLLQVFDRPQWLTIAGGARRYVERLLAPLRDRIRTGCPIRSVCRHASGVTLRPQGGPPEEFDAVVLACHADQALQLLEDADDEERELLAAFPYQPNVAVLHTDVALLPRRRRAWASWNYRIPREPGQAMCVTYDLSRLQRLPTPAPLLLTLNPGDAVAPARVLDRFVFHHPAFTPRSLAAQEALRARNGERRTYYCGAYGGYGFHEDGVRSALDVTRHFGLDLDQWKAASTRALSTTSA